MTEMTQRKKDGWEPVMLGGGKFQASFGQNKKFGGQQLFRCSIIRKLQGRK